VGARGVSRVDARAARRAPHPVQPERLRACAEGSVIAMQYFIGCHRPHWLGLTVQPLFISHRTLCSRKRLPRARGPWALDSGGFSELSMHGRWTTTAAEYAAAVRRYRDEIGGLQFAAQQDWMCEPSILAKTGLTVLEHQRRTIENYLELVRIAPDLPWMPVLQGWCAGDYTDHIEQWYAAGVELHTLPRVGVGSICRRQHTIRASLILAEIARHGIKVHAFGLKVTALRFVHADLASADSMAWSYAARRDSQFGKQHTGRKTGQQNQIGAALEWFEEKIAPLMNAPSVPPSAPPPLTLIRGGAARQQLSLFDLPIAA
jgi:hypothetical protein